MRIPLITILLFSSTFLAFAQCTPGCQQEITALQKQLKELQKQVPMSAQWPTASEAGTTPKPFQIGKESSKDFTLPYAPNFALVSWIAIRQRGSGEGDRVVDTPVLIVPTGQTVSFPNNICSGMKITLTGKNLRLQHDCQPLRYGGYPAFNIEFLP
jgi:hypothetical protein